MTKKLEPLNAKTLLFVQQYLIDRNGAQAAIRAGFSPKSAKVTASRLLTRANVKAAVAAGLAKAAEKAETDQEWVRRRLKEEAEDRTDGATHGGRIRAIELIAKLNGDFEKDNRQKADALGTLIGALSGKALGVSQVVPSEGED